MRKSRATLVVVFFGAVCAAGGSVDRVPPNGPDGLVNLARQPGARAAAASVYNDGRTAIHQIRHLNDGHYGNAHSWIARENPAWAEIDLGAPRVVCRIAFGRDNTGKFDDRSATRFEVLLAEHTDTAAGGPKWLKVYDYEGEPVSRRTEFSLCPRAARWVRVVVQASNINPIGIDELEVYGSTSAEMLRWVRATAPPPRLSPRERVPMPQAAAAVELPRDYPTFDPQPCRQPASPTALCLNGSDWRMTLVEEGHRGLRHMIDNDAKRWRRCTVPGSVQSALLESGGVVPLTGGRVPTPDYFGTNNLQLTFATACESWFKKTFRVPDDWRGKLVRLRFGAVDYQATFYLNGQRLGEHEGHFAPVALDATKAIRPGADNVLTVQIAPFPRDRTRCARSQILKNLQSDCTPAAAPLGISDDVFLIASEALCLADLCVRTALPDDLSRATVELRLAVESAADVEGEVVATIRSLQEPTQRVTARRPVRLARGDSEVTHSIEVAQPQLWWPNGAGPQNLYEARVEVRSADGRLLAAAATPFGIRKLEMALNEGAEGSRFPWTFVVNGRKVYAKGANWVPLDCFYRADAAMYDRLLLHARAAHFNMLRWWGGGVPERQAFYDLCDRYGIMLFHDFFLANGTFNDPAFLKLLERQARGFVRRLRNHPSIVLWTGGNEFGECAATRLLAKVAAEEDPTRPYRPPSPTAGEHHGPYGYRPPKHYADCNANRWPHFAQVRSEFGMCCAANADTLRKIIPAAELPALAQGNPFTRSWNHHNSHVWMDHATTHRLFGPIRDIETYCAASQLARAEGLRYAIEAMRRQKFHTSATLYWQYNETWPNAAGNATVDWFARPRLTHYYVAKAHEPVHACLRYERVHWQPGEAFAAELWAVSDRFDDLPACEAAWSIHDAAGRRVAAGAKTARLAANGSAKIGDVAWAIPKDCDSFFVVYCTIRDAKGGALLSWNEYVHTAHHTTNHPWSVLLEAPATELRLAARSLGKDTATVVVSNDGKANALVCTLALPVPARAVVLFSDNGFCLPPGGERTVVVRAVNPSRRDWLPDFSGLSVKAWNSRRVASPSRE